MANFGLGGVQDSTEDILNTSGIDSNQRYARYTSHSCHVGQPRLLFALGLKVRNSSRLWDKDVPWAYGNGHELEMRFFFGPENHELLVQKFVDCLEIIEAQAQIDVICIFDSFARGN